MSKNVNEMMVVENSNKAMKVEVSVNAELQKKRVNAMKPVRTNLVQDLSDAIMFGRADVMCDDFRHIPQEIEVVDIESQISFYETIVETGKEVIEEVVKKGKKAARTCELYGWIQYKQRQDSTFRYGGEGLILPEDNYEDSYEYFENTANALRQEYKWRNKNYRYACSQLTLAEERLSRIFDNPEEEDIKVFLGANTEHWNMVEWTGESYLIKLRNCVNDLSDMTLWKTMATVQAKRERKELTFAHFVEAMGMLYKAAYQLTGDIYYSHRLDNMRNLWKTKIAKTDMPENNKDVCVCLDKAWYDSKGKETTNPDRVAYGYSEIKFVPAACKRDAQQNVAYDSLKGSTGVSSRNIEAIMDNRFHLFSWDEIAA